MNTEHIEVLVEEPSMEAFLRTFLPRLLSEEVTFHVYPSRCKDELLKNLPDRLRGYASWLPPTWRIIVVVDRDDEDCHALKRRLEEMAAEAGLRTRADCARPRLRVKSDNALTQSETARTVSKSFVTRLWRSSVHCGRLILLSKDKRVM